MMKVELSYSDIVKLSEVFKKNVAYAEFLIFDWIKKNKGVDFFDYERKLIEEEEKFRERRMK